jgi:RNA polymerase sigma factor (sigma-70 family)
MTTATADRTDRQLLSDFAGRNDEEAFAELVRRHGPMVLGVCRQMLRHEQDAEDTFQATFLVLARKAGSVRTPEALSGWLYSVATRLAARNRAQAGRRRAREAPLVDTPADQTEGRPLGDELWPLLCEEIGQLPDRYRIPFVLCCLEGRTTEETARQLNCPPGTVSSRLARARERLRKRLGSRGLVVTSGLLAATLSALPPDAYAAVPAHLLRQTVRGAVSFSAGRREADGVSKRAAMLAAAQVALWGASGTKTIIVALLAIAVVCTAGGLVAWRAAGGRVTAEKAAVEKAAAEKAVAEKAVAEKAAGGNAVAEKTIEERLLGIWVLESFMLGERQMPGNPNVRIAFEDNGRFICGTPGSTYRIVNTRKTPMEIEYVTNGTYPGIFELRGDKLTVSTDMLPDRPRPPDFKPRPGVGTSVYSRARPGPRIKEPAPRSRPPGPP